VIGRWWPRSARPWLWWVEWTGSLVGASGAMLLALNLPISGYAWLFMLASNVAWITYAIFNRIGSILFMQVIYTITSIVGIYRWLM